MIRVMGCLIALPRQLFCSLVPHQIWLSNSANLTISKTEPSVLAFGFATNTNLALFTRTNLAFGAVTPLLATNTWLYQPVNMLCVPRSWAASPWVIERQIASLSAIFAVCGRTSPKRTPGSTVSMLPRGPR